jgi:hypothetical protein
VSYAQAMRNRVRQLESELLRARALRNEAMMAQRGADATRWAMMAQRIERRLQFLTGKDHSE